MKAFFVGILFLITLSLLAGIVFLFYPLLLLVGLLLRIFLMALLSIAAIWLLGKCVLFIWEKVK